MLYQRYFLRMNQNNAAHIVWLLLSLVFLLSIIHFTFVLSNSDLNQSDIDDDCYKSLLQTNSLMNNENSLLVYDDYYFFLNNNGTNNATAIVDDDGKLFKAKNSSVYMELTEVMDDSG
jgi:hypothetical protein